MISTDDRTLPYSFGQQLEAGWIPGIALLTPETGQFQQLLQTIGVLINTTKKRVIAASFALRYGWSSEAPLYHFMNDLTVPDLSLDNVSLHFCDTGLYRHYSFHKSVAVHRANDNRCRDPAAVRAMAAQLHAQAAPVVEVLHNWSCLSRHTLWSMVVSSWASQCVRIAESSWHDRNAGYALAEGILQYDPELYRNRPVFYGVQYGTEQRLFQKRKACCLYYLGPDRSFCTSCPLIEDDERANRSYRYLQEYGSHSTSH